MGSWCFHMTLKYEMQVSNDKIDYMLTLLIQRHFKFEGRTLLEDDTETRKKR